MNVHVYTAQVFTHEHETEKLAFCQQRLRMYKIVQAQEDPQNALPAELMRRYEVVIHPPAKMQPLRMRQVAARNIGKLVVVRVRPLSVPPSLLP